MVQTMPLQVNELAGGYEVVSVYKAYKVYKIKAFSQEV
jgi:hypothetical protein